MHLAITRSVLPQSPQANIIIGLDLLRLLVENRIAEFHTELELLSPEVGSQHTQTATYPAEKPQDLPKVSCALPQLSQSQSLQKLDEESSHSRNAPGLTIRHELASCPEQELTTAGNAETWN